MEVYRITLVRWSAELAASGAGARWNSPGMRMIYTAENRSLACLENVVHRSGEGLHASFRVMVIHIPGELKIETASEARLSKNWYKTVRCLSCRQFGDAWLRELRSPVLRVPSAIVRQEFNYLLNPLHPDFNAIAVVRQEPFEFDERIKLK